MSKIQVKVTDIKTTSNAPEIDDPEIAALLPTRLTPAMHEFVLEGPSAAVANSIRAVIAGEMLVKAMNFEDDDYISTDKFLPHDYVQTRIRLIPVKQDVPNNAVFTLDVVNNSEHVRRVESREIKIVEPKDFASKGKLPFNETFPIFTLNPGTSLKINNIKITQGYGYQHACYTCGFLTSSVPLDRKPGQKSSNSDTRKHLIKWETNGIMDMNTIVTRACSTIIERLKSVLDLITGDFNAITTDGDTYSLVVPGETDVIGTIIMKTATEMYPDVKLFNYRNIDLEGVIRFSIRTSEDVAIMLKNIINTLMGLYKTISQFFE